MVPEHIAKRGGFLQHRLRGDVVDAVVSVLCRMAFDLGLWSDGAAPLLIVCEEAHRYAAADRSAWKSDSVGAISAMCWL